MNNNVDYQYIDLLKDILENGYDHEDRTGTGRKSVFGRQLRFNMADGFPLITTRKIYTKALIEELLWFISGSKDNKILNEKGIHIWDYWAISENDKRFFSDFNDISDFEYYRGSIGNIYGPSWRNAPGGIDQLGNTIHLLKTKPFSSRHVISAWIPSWIPSEDVPFAVNIKHGKGSLAPCHVLQQYMVREIDGKKYLSLLMYQRSADVPIGVPYNIAQYALLLHMVAQVTDMIPNEFIWTSGDTHIYLNQLDKINKQLDNQIYPLPTLTLNPNIKNIDDFRFEDIEITNYQHSGTINYLVSI